MKIDEILKLMQDVPDYQSFLTVDELNDSMHSLAKRYPQVVQLLPFGKSRQGTPIHAMKIGSGAKIGLMFAMPHPNEPIGSMMLEFFSTRLAEDESLRDGLDTTWYIVKCIDVDGTRLNEGWFKGPFSLTAYAKHYYRPPSHFQVEWSFPMDYKTLHFDQPLPETQALMTLIEKVKPDFVFSLHNSGFGGVYAYVSHDEPAFYPDFYKVVESQALPLHLGEAEVPYAVTYSKAVFGMIGVEANYEFLLKNGVTDPALLIKSGCSSYEYASRFKEPHFLVCEMPYFYNPAIHDTSPSDMVRRDAVLKGLEMMQEQNVFFQQQYDTIKDRLTTASPFRDTVENQLRFWPEYLAAQENWAKNDPSLSVLATVAEKFDNLMIHRFYGLLSTGTFVRMIESEILTGKSDPLVQSALHTMQEKFDVDAALLENELKYEVVPIKKLASVQLGAGLLYASYEK
jgi:hypothetical protein